jgi:hypothetical protein
MSIDFGLINILEFIVIFGLAGALVTTNVWLYKFENRIEGIRKEQNEIIKILTDYKEEPLKRRKIDKILKD